MDEGARIKDKGLNTNDSENSNTKVTLTPPPLLKGGEGVRGREGTLGFKPQRKIKRINKIKPRKNKERR
ncbi:MAG: hypothetical protein ACI30J_04240 [Paludibacteraceae bacterium]